MEYFLNGVKVSASTALFTLENALQERGSCWDDYSDMWDDRYESEEAREALNEISGYTLEFVTND